MGLILGSLLTLTGDIRITMMIHISNNVFSVMQSLFVKSGSEFSLSPAGIIAVSYTHLDVYRRQPQGQA